MARPIANPNPNPHPNRSLSPSPTPNSNPNLPPTRWHDRWGLPEPPLLTAAALEGGTLRSLGLAPRGMLFPESNPNPNPNPNPQPQPQP